MLIPRRPNFSKLALLPVLCVLASCATPDAGRRAESATTAEALLAEARHAKDPAAQIGFALAAADSAARNLSLGDARLTYNAACVELAARVRNVHRQSLSARHILDPVGNLPTRIQHDSSVRSLGSFAFCGAASDR